MSIYTKLNSSPKHRTEFDFKAKQEHVVTVNVSIIVFQNNYVQVEIVHEILVKAQNTQYF